MKHRITLSIALVLGVAFLSLMSFGATAAAAQAAAAPQRYFADTGVITLGPNQLLRVTVAPAANSNTGATVSFNNKFYICDIPGCLLGCGGGQRLCILTADSETTTDPVRLMASESASMDITPTPNSSAVRCMVTVDRSDVKVKALIIDTTTGAISSGRDINDIHVFQSPPTS